MKQRRENILDLLDIMDEGNLTALRFKDGQVEIELERKPAAGALSASTLPLMAERVGQLLNAREDATGVVDNAYRMHKNSENYKNVFVITRYV